MGNSSTSSLSCDVVVAGAGPAGSATAIYLARQGFDVILLDRARFPRDKVCGDYLTPGAVRILHSDLGILGRLIEAGARPVNRETIVGGDGRGFDGPTTAFSSPRRVTDSILVQIARSAGVAVYEGVAVRNLSLDGDRVTGLSGVDAEGRPFMVTARVTVGADGAHSLVARKLGQVRPIAHLQRIALRAYAHGDSADGVAMYLPSDGTRACCGIGPSSTVDGRRNVNMVLPRTEAGHIAGRKDEYFHLRLSRSFPAAAERLAGVSHWTPVQTVGCFGHYTRRAAYNGALLVGDAAAFVDPLTGEGVYFALEGSRLAAQAIDAALTTGDVSYRSLRAYDLDRRRTLAPRYRLCEAVHNVVGSPALFGWIAGRLRRSPDLAYALLRTLGDAAEPRELLTASNLFRLIAQQSDGNTRHNEAMRWTSVPD